MAVQGAEFEGFCRLIGSLRTQRPPVDEAELEASLARFLFLHGIKADEQPTTRLGRHDLVVQLMGSPVCIEIKKRATASCVRQVDRYAHGFDGLILFCHSATANLRRIFAEGQKSAKIPIRLIELREGFSLA